MSATAVKRIRQVSMTAYDLKRAIAFYRDVVGLTFLFEAPPQLAFFDCGGVRIMLAPPEGNKEHAHPGSVLYYLVDDIRGAAKTMAAKGAEIGRASWRERVSIA